MEDIMRRWRIGTRVVLLAGMAGSAEQALRAQWRRAGPVRVGDTMHRPRHHRSSYVDGLLRHLAASGFDGVPRPLGYDDEGRQILTFIPGEVVDRPTPRSAAPRL